MAMFLYKSVVNIIIYNVYFKVLIDLYKPFAEALYTLLPHISVYLLTRVSLLPYILCIYTMRLVPAGRRSM